MQATGLIGSKGPRPCFSSTVPCRNFGSGSIFRGFRMRCSTIAGSAWRGETSRRTAASGFRACRAVITGLPWTRRGNRIQGTGSFAVIPDPAKRRTSPDSPFCMDAALNVVETVRTAGGPGGREEGVRRFVGLAGLAGLNFVRERIHQDRAEPRPGRL